MSIIDEISASADSAEVYCATDELTSVSFSAGRVKSASRKETSGIGLRIDKNGRLGTASAIGEYDERELIQNAISSAEFGDEMQYGFAPALTPAAEVATYDPEVEKLSIERTREIGQRISDAILANYPDSNVEVGVSFSCGETKVATTEGADCTQRYTYFSCSAGCELVRGDDILIVGDGEAAKKFDAGFAEKIIDSILKRMDYAAKITTIGTGKMPIIFSPEGIITLLLPLMQGLNGKTLAQGISPLEGKEGEKLFDEKFSLVDDPTLPLKTGSRQFDDEAVPAMRNVLIEEGVLRGFCLDLKTAAKTGKRSTGSASRGVTSLPTPSFSNLLVAPGTTPLTEMLASIKEGLWVDSVLGLGQGNIISGAFSNSIGLGFKIENGEITGRVKNVSIAGNVYEVLKEIAAVSAETKWQYGSLCVPYLLMENIPIVGN